MGMKIAILDMPRKIMGYETNVSAGWLVIMRCVVGLLFCYI